MDNPEELYTVPEVAEIKGVFVQSVYRAIKEGRLKAEKRKGTVLVRKREMDAWKAKRGRFNKE